MALTQIPDWRLQDRLARALDVNGVSVQEMADWLGLSRQTVGNYLAGRQTPKHQTLVSWAIRCGVSLTWLETGVAPEEGGGADTQSVTLWQPRDGWTVSAAQLPGQLSFKVAA